MRFIHIIGRRWIVASLGALVVLHCGPARGDFLVTSDLTDEVLRYNNNGGMKGAFVTAESGGLNSPKALAWGPDGNLYVGGSNRVKKYDGKSGAYLGDAYAPPNMMIFGLAFAPDGDLLISTDQYVYRADLATRSSVTIPIGYVGGHLLLTPDGGVLVGNGSGPGSWDMIKKINLSNNQVSTFASGGGLLGPFGLEYGPDGMIYSLNVYGSEGDPNNTAIYRIDPDSGAVLGRWAEVDMKASTDLMFIEGNRLWVSALLTDQLHLLDSRTGEFVKNVQGGSYNWDMLHMPEPGSVMGIGFIAGVGLLRRRQR